MLSYAYENLRINKKVLKDSVDYKNVHDLFARILINVINTLIKRGFYKEYILKNEDVFSPKGKINLTETIKRRSLIHKKLNCQYNDFNNNVLFNQIIKTTIDNLLKVEELDNGLKKKLKKFKPFFNKIDSIELNRQVFQTLMWNKNNEYYSLAVTICELIYLYQLPEDNSKGEILFKEFIKNHENELANLFENFVFNFYKKEVKQIKVYKPKIKWNIDNNFKNRGIDYLPNMRTDIVLENDEKQLIIDTKFYKNILSVFYQKESFNSANLYQISTYISNSDFSGEVSGMLLYASIGDDIDYQFKINDQIIYIKTLDLNQDWKDIDRRLKDISRLLI